MIVDRLHNSSRYEMMLPQLKTAFEFLRQCEEKELPEGFYELDGDEVFANVMCYETQDQTALQFERHRRYLDVHYIRRGQECVLWNNTGGEALEIQYNQDEDVSFFQEMPGVGIPLCEGGFMLLFPDDFHKPKCILDSPCMVDKVVIKVQL